MLKEDLFERMEGAWQGKSSLQVSLDEPVRDSQSQLHIRPVIKGKFLEFRYDWLEKEVPQEGLLLVGYDEPTRAAKAIWLDSWHTGEDFMIFQGSIDRDGEITLLGSYPAPDGPDWGWRIVIRPEGDWLKLQMDNISPEADELWAVMADYMKTA